MKSAIILGLLLTATVSAKHKPVLHFHSATILDAESIQEIKQHDKPSPVDDKALAQLSQLPLRPTDLVVIAEDYTYIVESAKGGGNPIFGAMGNGLRLAEQSHKRGYHVVAGDKYYIAEDGKGRLVLVDRDNRERKLDILRQEKR